MTSSAILIPRAWFAERKPMSATLSTMFPAGENVGRIDFTFVDNMCSVRRTGSQALAGGRLRPQEDPMIRLRRLSALTLPVVAALLAAACGSGSSGGSSDSGSGPTKIKVGVIPIVDVAPIYLGIKQGFFTAENLDVSVETAQGGAAIVPGVVSGQYQFGFSNTTSLLLASSKGLPLKVISAGNASTGDKTKDFGGVIVKADSPIKTAADLAGKKIAVNTLKNI